jgi:hypothetical protein
MAFTCPVRNLILRKLYSMARLNINAKKASRRQLKKEKLSQYFWREVHCLRSRSTLTRERVKNSEAFVNTRKENEFMAKASKLASEVYQNIPPQTRKYAQYRVLTGEAIKLLRGGIDEKEVLESLLLLK